MVRQPNGNNGALLAGVVGGVMILAIIAWLMLRTSARMPIGKFFSISSILVAVLAVVLAGKGVAGLQEAGWLGASPIHWPRIEVLGVYPSAETAIAQFIVLAIPRRYDTSISQHCGQTAAVVTFPARYPRGTPSIPAAPSILRSRCCRLLGRANSRAAARVPSACDGGTRSA